MAVEVKVVRTGGVSVSVLAVVAHRMAEYGVEVVVVVALRREAELPRLNERMDRDDEEAIIVCDVVYGRKELTVEYE